MSRTLCPGIRNIDRDERAPRVPTLAVCPQVRPHSPSHLHATRPPNGVPGVGSAQRTTTEAAWPEPARIRHCRLLDGTTVPRTRGLNRSGQPIHIEPDACAPTAACSRQDSWSSPTLHLCGGGESSLRPHPLCPRHALCPRHDRTAVVSHMTPHRARTYLGDLLGSNNGYNSCRRESLHRRPSY